MSHISRFVRLSRPIAAIAWTMTLAIFSMGAQCNPTRRSCQAETDGQGLCGFRVGRDGTPGFLPACIDLCQPQPPGNPAGARCVLDPCDDAAFSQATPAYLCPEPYSCEPSGDPGFGTCLMNGLSFAVECTLNPGSPVPQCQTGLYCRPAAESCGPVARLADILGVESYDGANGEGYCYLPQREGEACDSSWNEYRDQTISDPQFPELCLACEPGLECVSGTCQRECQDLNDCPCPTSEFDFNCVGGFCDFCIENYVTCQDDSQCCNRADGATCENVDGQSMCCHGIGASCDGARDQCCPDTYCDGEDTGSGECAMCRRRGEAFDENDPESCCEGLSPRLGSGGTLRCLPSCARTERGESCRTCADGNEIFYECDDVRGDVCPSVPLYDTSCDDVDDDCDGVLYPDSWTSSACADGMVAVVSNQTIVDTHCVGDEFPGHYQCVWNASHSSVEPECIADYNAYCMRAVSGPDHLPGLCSNQGAPCAGLGNDACSYNETCAGGVGGPVCTTCVGSELCWEPGEPSSGACP